MKVSCPYCGNHWFLTPEALALAVENSPAKGRSIGVECPRCRHLVKIARPRHLPAVEVEQEEPQASEVSEEDEA